MIEIENILEGSMVHYQPEHYGPDKFENGIVKVIKPEVKDGVWVVYNCNYQWNDYENYTSAKTRLEDLHYGWRT